MNAFIESEDVKGPVAIKSFQDEDGKWHWIAIRIHDLQPMAMCCHKIQTEQESKPS